MAAKKKAAKAGGKAVAAGSAARNNQYLQRLATDAELREDLRTAYDSARKAYNRANGKGPAKALDDKKVQKEIKEAVVSLQSAAQALRQGPRRKKKRRKLGSLLGVALIGGAVALAASENLRKKVLDALFGAEEEFEYSSTTTPTDPAASEEPAVS